MKKVAFKSQFLDELHLFCFLHLGSDVDMRVEDDEEWLKIKIDHHRVHSLRFDISYQSLEKLLKDPEKLEQFMLEKIISHRR